MNILNIVAAHCTYETASASDIRALIGAHNFYSLGSQSKFVEVETIHNHPEYDNTTINYDFAILTLKEDLDYSYGVNEICMPRYIFGGGEKIDSWKNCWKGVKVLPVKLFLSLMF